MALIQLYVLFLNLERINKETKHRMIIVCTVQIILEGMGRALHTNFNARFKCDALKVRFGVHVSFGI